jgi:cell division control protein 7
MDESAREEDAHDSKDDESDAAQDEDGETDAYSEASDDSDEVVTSQVQEDMRQLEDNFAGIRERFRLINRIGEGI